MSAYPFSGTWNDPHSAEQLALTGGRGVHLEAADGTRWLDFTSAGYQANLGHGHPRMIEAIRRQAGELCVAIPNAAMPTKRALAQQLLELAPEGFAQVFFTPSGAVALECAVDIARTVTGRHQLIRRYRSDHGLAGAFTLAGPLLRSAAEPVFSGVLHALDCYCHRCPFGQEVDTCARECARQIGDILTLAGPNNVAAVVIEPVVSANGVLIPPVEYLPIVREECDRRGTLIVADEILTGLGRTGYGFACEHFDAVPDFICVAQGLTGGYAPLGAVLVHERVAEHFADAPAAIDSAHDVHPLGCAAALEALHIYREERLFERASALGPVLLSELRGLLSAMPRDNVCTAVRGLGLLAACELDLSPAEWNALIAAVADRNLCLNIYPEHGTVVFAPPLCIEESTLRRGIATYGEALERVLSAPTRNCSREDLA